MLQVLLAGVGCGVQDLSKSEMSCTWLGAFGSLSPKPIKLFHSRSAWVSRLHRPRPLVRGRLAKRRGKKVWGNTKKLTRSAAYPEGFAAAVVDALARHVCA